MTQKSIKQKCHGQYMTPDWIVTIILDEIGYCGEKIISQSIMEPSFGDGAFLSEIVQRLIIECQKVDKAPCEIAEILNCRVFGIEKDKILYEKAIERLNQILETYSISPIQWTNLVHGDALIEYRNFIKTQDYCVGNPPWVKMKNILEEERVLLKQFHFSQGMTDLYVVFYEIGLEMLQKGGKLGYLTPKNFLKNKSQKDFRRYLSSRHYLSSVYDFGSSKLFDNANIYTCICLLDKETKSLHELQHKKVHYIRYCEKEQMEERWLDSSAFSDKVEWEFFDDASSAFLGQNRRLPYQMKDIANIQNGIVTGKDAVYIIKAYTDKQLTKPYTGKGFSSFVNTLVHFQDLNGRIVTIESAILRRCVKIEKYKGSLNNTYIIFPYLPQHCRYSPEGSDPEQREPDNFRYALYGFDALTEKNLKRSFPYAYRYLSSMKDILSVRRMDDKLDWFLFTKSQGLSSCGLPKLIFNTFINKARPKINTYLLDDDVIPYSGKYITLSIDKFLIQDGGQDGSLSFEHRSWYLSELEHIRNILSSEEFATYCSLVGRERSGGYVDIYTNQIKEFGVSISL